MKISALLLVASIASIAFGEVTITNPVTFPICTQLAQVHETEDTNDENPGVISVGYLDGGYDAPSHLD